MDRTGTDIRMKIVSSSEVSFASYPYLLNEESAMETLQVGFSNKIQYDATRDFVALTLGIRYEQRENTVLECAYCFNFEVTNLDRYVTLLDGTTQMSKLLPHLIDVAVGAMRGIIIVRTAGTILSNFPLPIVNPIELSSHLPNY